MTVRTSTSTFAIVAASLCISILPSIAHAQQAAPATAPDDAAANEDGIADIIVTASRREQSLQKTAIPVTVVTGETLSALGVANLQTLTKLAPTLKLGQSGGGGIQITTRGVGNVGANSANEPGVAINYDGAYVARSFGANGIFFDVARVELLKGPQGTLYGRNSTGGVLNIITNDPTDEFGGNLTVESGNYSHLRAAGALNVPIAQGVALRVSGQAVDRRGYLTDGYNDEKGYAGRAKLLLEPTSQLSILLEANVSVNKGKGIAGVFSPFIDPSNPYVGPSDPRSNAIIAAVPGVGAIIPRILSNGFQRIKSRQLIGTVNYDLGGVKATLIVANTRNTQHYLIYTAGFPVAEDSRATPGKYTTAELRLASSGDGPLKWVLGGFYYDEVLTVNPFVNQGTTFGDTRNLRFPIKSYSGFGEATYSVTSNIRLTAGGRYTSDKKTLNGVTLNPRPGQLQNGPCPAPSSLVAYTGPAVLRPTALGQVCSTPDTGSATYSKFTYKLGAEADLGSRSLLYANYTTGFKSGGFYASANYNAAGAFPSNAYRPETITAITIGSKNRFLDNKLQVNVEGFRWKFKNKQISHLGFVPPNNQLLVVDNAGDATIYGAELDVVWQPTKNDDLSFNVQYLHSNYGRFSYDALVPGFAAPFAPGSAVPSPVTGCAFTATRPANGVAPRGTGVPGLSTIDCTGRPLSFAPSWSASASYRHTFELAGGSTLVPSVSTRVESGFYVGEEYFAGQYQKSYMMSDASLTWAAKGQGLSLTAYINNIENEAVAQGSSLNGTIRAALNTLRPPRTYGIRANIRF
jgi:iron complex outermembrane recepter protein